MGRKLPSEKEVEILRLYATNLKIREIEEKTGSHPRTIYDVLRRNNVPTRYEVNMSLPRSVDPKVGDKAAIELTIDRIKRFIGPKTIAEHHDLDSPYEDPESDAYHPKVRATMNSLSRLYVRLAEELTVLNEES